MLKRIFLAMAIATVAASAFFVASDYIGADSSPGVALTGQVSSKEEGMMEGVLVSAKKDDSTITITVVSDEKGRYNFPASKVGPGHYSLKIRASDTIWMAPRRRTSHRTKLRRPISNSVRRKTSPRSSPTRNGWQACPVRRTKRNFCSVAIAVTRSIAL